MIKPTSATSSAPAAIRADDHRRERDAPDGPSFEIELAAEDRRPGTTRESKGGRREPKDRDASPDGALAAGVAAPNDPRALDPRRAPEAPVATGLAGSPMGVAAQALAAQSLQLGSGAATAPAPAAPDVDAAALLELDSVADMSAVVASQPVVSQLGSALVASELDNAALVAPDDEAIDDDASGDFELAGDDWTRLDARPPDAAAPIHARVAPPTPVDGARLADQVADAVRKLAAEVADQSDVVRFRSADFSFSAVVRHDGGATQVRLLSDDPNTRAFLGDRLPAVRQALERVGFASTSLSVATDADRQQRERHPQQPRDELADEPGVAPAAPTSTTAPRVPSPPGDRRGLNLIL